MSVESAEQHSNKEHSCCKTDRHTGCVKWFNNKSGYGFITLMDKSDDYKGRDIFSHHSSIKASGDLYKYLVQGEYVEFDVQTMDSKEHEHQAVNITGVLGGDLMCETRFKNKDLSRVRDGFAPPRRLRTNERSERPARPRRDNRKEQSENSD
tara:strand:+ start:42 stop:497 length:456 start_codon:yes stop_codon:yes gene_type:complete